MTFWVSRWSVEVLKKGSHGGVSKCRIRRDFAVVKAHSGVIVFDVFVLQVDLADLVIPFNSKLPAYSL